MDLQLIHTLGVMKAYMYMYAYLLQHLFNSCSNWKHSFCHCLFPNKSLQTALPDDRFLLFSLIGLSQSFTPSQTLQLSFSSPFAPIPQIFETVVDSFYQK